MRIGITGTSQGIGKAIADLSAERKHEVRSFSLGNGYKMPENLNRVVDEGLECDAFVISTYMHETPHDEVQLQILLKLAEGWQAFRNRTIICIGSGASKTTRINGQFNADKFMYALNKHRLEEACVSLAFNDMVKCRVAVVNPGRVDTDRVKNVPGTKLTPRQVAECVLWIAEAPLEMNIYTVGIQHPTWGGIDMPTGMKL